MWCFVALTIKYWWSQADTLWKQRCICILGFKLGSRWFELLVFNETFNFKVSLKRVICVEILLIPTRTIIFYTVRNQNKRSQKDLLRFNISILYSRVRSVTWLKPYFNQTLTFDWKQCDIGLTEQDYSAINVLRYPWSYRTRINSRVQAQSLRERKIFKLKNPDRKP